MREIKFRAWDEQNKVMHNEVEFIRSGIDGNDWILFKSDKQKLEDGNVLNNPYFQQQIKLMQYTGLKDKNDVEIYEYMEIGNTYEVSFLNGSYVLTNISNGDIMLLSNYMENNNGKVEITREYTKV